MLFWCNYCERAFESEPESALLEQANCENCKWGCISFELEYEDARQSLKHGHTVMALFGWLLGGFFETIARLLVLPTTNSSGKPLNTSPILVYAAEIHFRQTKITDCDCLPDAHSTAAFLRQRCINAQISEVDVGYSIYVDDEDAELARRFLTRRQE